MIRLKEPKAKTVKPIVSNAVKLYPNTAKSITTINCNLGIKQIEIYDIVGKQTETIRLNNVNTFSLNISKYNKGLYVVKLISANNELLTNKLIVE